jgi:hypothetical protein
MKSAKENVHHGAFGLGGQSGGERNKMEARGSHGKPFVSNNSPFCFLGVTETRRKTKAKARLEFTEVAEATEA